MKILITGASGFIGSFLCEEALKRGMEVWAGMRAHSSRRWLQNERYNFAFLDLSRTEVLTEQLHKYKKRLEKWDVIIHAGGATKCLDPKDFDKHNFECTKNFVETLLELDMMPSHFVYVSSLSVLGALKENPVTAHTLNLADPSFEWALKDSVYEPMTSEDTPRPNTAYAQSKVKSEEWLDAKSRQLRESGDMRMIYTIFRPTGVYGPKEQDYYVMAKSIKQHIDFAVGFKPQEITFVYVVDLVNAIFAAIGRMNEGANLCGRKYFVSDGYVYNSRAFSDLLQREMGTKNVLHITAPLWVLRCICTVSGWISKLTRKPIVLNKDKYNMLSQRNWQCDITALQQDLGFTPEWNLERGVKETVAWYKKEGWL